MNKISLVSESSPVFHTLEYIGGPVYVSVVPNSLSKRLIAKLA